MKWKTFFSELAIFCGGIIVGILVAKLWVGAIGLDTGAHVYELDFGNGRIHNVATYQGAAYLMLRMEPGAVSVYDLPKRKNGRKGK